MVRRLGGALLVCMLAGCGSDDGVDPIAFAPPGPLVGEAGRGSFVFGAASAATQIEDGDTNTDWYVWSQPVDQGGLGNGTFVGDAVAGYSRATEDVGLVADLGLDSYRFSIEWARIEPQRDVLDEDAIAHYRAELEDLRARGIRPVVTVHHFSNPIWVDDPRDLNCAAGPSDSNLCGFGHPTGGPLVVAELGQHAALLADRFGDLVDEWGTVNEPINYLLAAYGVGYFPPGKKTYFHLQDEFVPVLRDYLAAHAAIYHAIKAHDTVDADGDGVAAAVGLSMSVADWEPSRGNAPSDRADDAAARDRLVYAFHYLVPDAVTTGSFDTNLDGTPDEEHPDWAGTVDWLGVQYYFRAGVSGEVKVIPLVDAAPCFASFDFGACLPAADPTFCVPTMGYEAWTPGLKDVLVAFGARYPQLPLLVSEAGIASRSGARRAENIARTLEAIGAARAAGVDVRGYYYWSLTDNFEWAEGFAPQFGLYSVDRTTLDRTPTEGAELLRAVTQTRTLTIEQRQRYGGTGPLTADPDFDGNPLCTNSL